MRFKSNALVIKIFFIRCICVFAFCFPLSVTAGLDNLISSVAVEIGVPAPVIKAVCTHESQTFYKGRRQPWPWTLNVGGQGFWFKNKRSAISFAEREFASNESDTRLSIDIGMCQINWYWHGDQFQSVSELLDPLINVRYAATYLKHLKDSRRGSWEDAIGAYHSPSNKERAKRYALAVLSSP